jgi:hypothetical protein
VNIMQESSGHREQVSRGECMQGEQQEAACKEYGVVRTRTHPLAAPPQVVHPSGGTLSTTDRDKTDTVSRTMAR